MLILLFLVLGRYNAQEEVLKDLEATPAGRQAVIVERRHLSAANGTGVIVGGRRAPHPIPYGARRQPMKTA